jgi:hypothetical protein
MHVLRHRNDTGETSTVTNTYRMDEKRTPITASRMVR